MTKKAEKDALEAAEASDIAKIKTVSFFFHSSSTISICLNAVSFFSAGQVKPSRGAEKAVVKKEEQIEAAGGERVVDVYEARSIDDALDLLSLTSSSSASASKETLERHPERRMKAAYTQYEERELPLLKVPFFPSFLF